MFKWVIVAALVSESRYTFWTVVVSESWQFLNRNSFDIDGNRFSPCGHSMSIWSSMGVGILIITILGQIWRSTGAGTLISYCLCMWTAQVNLKFIGVAIFDNLFPAWTFNINLKFHGGGYHLILVASPSQFQVPWGWECWYHIISYYHITLVNNPSHFEVPWGWGFW